MKQSLQRHLSLVLGMAIVFSGIVAAIASFALSYSEAREFQDDMLRQIAVLSQRSVGDHALGEVMADVAIDDPESRIEILTLPGSKQPDWLPADLSVGFHTLDAGSDRRRVFVVGDLPGPRTVVAQPTDARDEIALHSALRTLLPLFILLPLLLWLIVRIIRREFQPISQLAQNLDDRPADNPQPMATTALPEEITPFVEAINRLLARLGHLLGEQRRFIADAAHELRSPLTALAVQAENLRQAPSLAEVQARIAPLQAGIERARQLTGQLLDLARIQASTGSHQPTDVAALARTLIGDYFPLAAARDIDLGLEKLAPLSLTASPESLRLILGNALENAIKYVPVGGEVTLKLSVDGDSGMIEVIDNGPGIPPAERQRIFDAFYRLPGSPGDGSGLGLAIAREAAKRLGGSINIRDRQPGPGLIFSYRQPLTDIHANNTQA